MLLALTIATTFIDPNNRVYRKDEVYDVSEALGQQLLSLADDQGIPRFKLAKKPVVQATAEEAFEKGVVRIPDAMKKGATASMPETPDTTEQATAPAARKKFTVGGSRGASLTTDADGEIDTAAG
jgi:hypothetical protein